MYVDSASAAVASGCTTGGTGAGALRQRREPGAADPSGNREAHTAYILQNTELE